MKINTLKCLVMVFVTGICAQVNAQENYRENTQGNEVIIAEDPIFYLGTGTGINFMNGMIGLNGEARPFEKLTIVGGAGLSSWGFRGTGGVRLYKHYPKGLYYTFSFSGNGGAPELDLELETTNGNTELVTLELGQANTINLGLGTQITFLRNVLRFNLDIGYSIPLNKNPYSVLSDHVLSDLSKDVIGLISPGGIILGFGLSVGIQ